MKKNILSAVLSFFLFIVIMPIFLSIKAASLQLDPATLSTPSGQTFTVNVNVSAGTDSIKSADAYIIYDPTILQAQSVTDGTFFGSSGVVNKDLSTSGKAYVSGMVSDPTQPVTGQGTMASITFSTLTDGTDTLKFDCTAGSSNSSTVIKADSTDTNLIDCTANGISVVTVGTGANANPTSTPEATVAPTVPMPSTLPKSGVFDNVVKFAVPGMILLLLGGAVRLML